MKNKKIICIMFLIMIIFSFMIFTDVGLAKQTTAEAFKALYDEFKIELAGFVGIGICISVISFIVNLIRLGFYSSNGAMRRLTIRNLIISGICTAMLGSISFVVILFISIFFGK